MKGLQLNRMARTVFVVVAVGLAADACYLYFPGAMTWDSFDQLRQARVNDYVDWQPPAMAYLWRHLLWLNDGPGVMLIFHVAMLCLGSVLLCAWSVRQGLRFGAMFALIPLLPWVMNFEFVIWKDMGMAYAWFLAAAIAIFYADRERFPPAAAFAVLGFFLYGFLVRANSPAGALFFLPFLASCIFKRKSLVFYGLNALCVVLAFLVLPKALNTLLAAESRHPTSYVMFDDLVGLRLTGVPGDPNILTADDLARVKSCELWNKGQVGSAFCIGDTFEDLRANRYSELKAEWLSAVTSNPGAYLSYRLGAFVTLLRSPDREPYYISEFRVPKPPYLVDSETQSPSAGAAWIEDYVARAAVALPMLFKPYFWLILSLLLALLMKVSLSRYAPPYYLLPLSGVSYMIGFIPITPAGDLRYAYWLCLIATASLMLFLVMVLSRGRTT
ncbi:MAG: hypothetical protein ACREX5_16040 [Achromobacter pestifer]